MSTKAIMAQQVIRRISGGDQPGDSQLDRREVIRVICQIINDRVKMNFYENYKLGESGIDGLYIATYKNVAVSYDSDTNEFYSLLPSTYAALPNGRGIRQVSSMKNQRKAFVIRKSGSASIYSNLPAGRLEGRVGVFPEGTKLIYTTDMNKSGVKKVLIKLAVGAPESIGENDTLPLDAAAEKSVVDEAIAFFRDPVVQDKLNNNNPQQ